ncbi:hypothetical protein B0H11DRAFT_2289103 [Mycena galericulata]|nr:hypothetical protein B0H11DRAFT_2289103 [Mycena galericulata]
MTYFDFLNFCLAVRRVRKHPFMRKRTSDQQRVSPFAPQTYQNVLDFRHHFTHAKEMVLALQSPIQAMYMPTGFLGSDDLDTPDTGDAFEGDLESRNCGTVIYSKSSSDSAVQPGKMWLDARDEDSPEHVLTTMRVELGNIGLLVADSPPATYHQVCQTTASLGRKINTLESIWKRT